MASLLDYDFFASWKFTLLDYNEGPKPCENAVLFTFVTPRHKNRWNSHQFYIFQLLTSNKTRQHYFETREMKDHSLFSSERSKTEKMAIPAPQHLMKISSMQSQKIKFSKGNKSTNDCNFAQPMFLDITPSSYFEGISS